MNIKSVLVVILSAMVILAGCILSGTGVITQVIVPDEDGLTVNVTPDDIPDGKMDIDLTDDATFNDYKANISNIESIGFYLEVTNNTGEELTLQFMLEEDVDKIWPTVDTLVDSVTALLFTGLTLAPDSKTTIDWGQSIEYVTGLGFVNDIVETGTFSLYPVAIPREDFDFTIDSMVVIVTLTGKK